MGSQGSASGKVRVLLFPLSSSICLLGGLDETSTACSSSASPSVVCWRFDQGSMMMFQSIPNPLVSWSSLCASWIRLILMRWVVASRQKWSSTYSKRLVSSHGQTAPAGRSPKGGEGPSKRRNRNALQSCTIWHFEKDSSTRLEDGITQLLRCQSLDGAEKRPRRQPVLLVETLVTA